MAELPSQRWVTRRIGGFLLAVVAVAVVFAVRGSWHAPPDRREPMERPEFLEGEETPATRAARLAAVDSSQKRAWVGEIPGLDVSMLTPAEEKQFIRFANAQSCTCGCGFTLAACRRYDAQCDISLPLIEQLRDSLRGNR